MVDERYPDLRFRALRERALRETPLRSTCLSSWITWLSPDQPAYLDNLVILLDNLAIPRENLSIGNAFRLISPRHKVGVDGVSLAK